jgi:dTDP-glucose 4,6-dehydratase
MVDSTGTASTAASDSGGKKHKPRRAMVTGGAGFIGSHLCDALLQRDFDVTCVDSFVTGSCRNIAHLLHRADFHVIERDVADGVGTDEPVDVVIHSAAPANVQDFISRPRQSLATLTSGTEKVLDYALRHAAQFVLISSSDASPERGRIDAGDPASAHRLARQLAESMTELHRDLLGLDASVVRVFTTFGPRMREDVGFVVPTFIRRAIDDEPILIPGSGATPFALCFIDDLVRGVLAVLTKPVPVPIELGGAPELPVAALAHRVVAAAHSKSAVIVTPFPRRAVANRAASTGLARELLGWVEQTPLAVGLAATISAMREVELLRVE